MISHHAELRYDINIRIRLLSKLLILYNKYQISNQEKESILEMLLSKDHENIEVASCLIEILRAQRSPVKYRLLIDNFRKLRKQSIKQFVNQWEDV